MADLYTELGYDKTSLELITQDLSRYYITYRIAKRNGKSRRIDAPQEPLKTIQRVIATKILYRFRAHPLAHGFVYGRSPKTNAEVHLGKKCVLTVDIRNFFNTTHQIKVERTLSWLLSQNPFITATPGDITLLAQLMCYNDVLPQGAPTSPIMSNLVCIPLDKELVTLGTAQKCTITRYADDITVSSDNRNIFKIHTHIYELLLRHGFSPNRRKTKFRQYYQRQQVTGIIVNKQTGVRKEEWRILRATLHNLHKNNTAISLSDYQKLRGKIEWVRTLNQARGQQLLQALSQLNVS